MKCPQCPVRAGLQCVGEWHAPVCRDVEDGIPGRADQLVEMAEANEQPGLIDKAASLARNLVDHIGAGLRVAPPEVQSERERICRSNECGQVVHDGRGCNACGCGSTAAVFNFIGLDMARKRRWASSRCALDPPRWDAC